MFKIFSENQKAVEKDVYFKLEQKYDREIVLVACNEQGVRLSQGDVVGITADGTLKRYPNCDVPGLQTGGDKIELKN